MSSQPSVCVVIPVYNEEAGVETCVEAVLKALSSLPCRSELVMVNDGSRDRTGEILARLDSGQERMAVVTHPQNRGYGSALRTGVERAFSDGFDYALFMDSDMTNEPAIIPKFVEKMAEGYDVIKASRYIEGGHVCGVSFLRRAISIIGNHVARFLYGLPITDCTNGFRAIKTGLVHEMDLRETGFPIIMEELYKCKFTANRYCEIPYTLTVRAGNLAKSGFAYRPGVFYRYLKYPLRSFLHIRPRGCSGKSEATEKGA